MEIARIILTQATRQIEITPFETQVNANPSNRVNAKETPERWLPLTAAIFLCSLMGLTDLIAADKAPFLTTFSAISADSSAVYFQGDAWTAIWKRQAPRPACVPVNMVKRPRADDGHTISYQGDRFGVSGDTLWWAKGVVTGKTYVLPAPTDEALRELRKVGKLDDNASLSLGEEMRAVDGEAGRIWFGLMLFDEVSGASVSGLGWFDLETEKFVRLYSADIGKRKPSWIAAFEDSVFVLYSQTVQGTEDSRLYLYEIASGGFFEANLRAMGISGDQVLAASRSGDSLLFSTDYGISLWQLGKSTRNFATLAVAPLQPVGLKFRTSDSTFESGVYDIPFDTLAAGVSVRVWWKEGEWYEVAVPRPVEGFVGADVWEKFGHIWEGRLWDCGHEPCFTKVQIPMRGQIQAVDFIHAPLTYLGSSSEGARVGVNAAWVAVKDVVPVFMETQLQH